MKKKYENFFLYKPDPMKDLAIDEFLNTPIDSRTSSVDPDFSKPIHITPYQQQKQIKKKPKTEKELMHDWDIKINRLSRNIILPQRVRKRELNSDHPSLAERALIKKPDLTMRARTAQARDKDTPKFPETRETNTARSSFMPLRKNEIPVGRHMPEGLLIKRVSNPYE